MPSKRKVRFENAVAEAARSVKTSPKRGRPTPKNLTVEGREKGLSAMQKAPRCNRRNRDGLPCAAPAMRGSSRCLKHGGRVEVPDHPHNIRRFFGKDEGRVKSFGPDDVSDQAHWEQLPYRLKREVLDLLPPHVIANPLKFFLAARVWMEVRDRNYSAVQRFLNAFVRN